MNPGATVKSSHPERIAKQALEALQLRRRLDRGDLSRKEYLERLNVLQELNAPMELPQRELPPVQPPLRPPQPVWTNPLPFEGPRHARLEIIKAEAVSERFLAMRCPRCTGDVRVYDRTTHLQCGDCGAEIAVERKNCTIALRAAVPSGAETADDNEPGPPTELEEELLRNLRAEAAMITNVKRTAGIIGGLCAVTFVYAGVTEMAAQQLAMGGTVFFCGSVLLATVYCITRHTGKVRAQLSQRIRAITDEV